MYEDIACASEHTETVDQSAKLYDLRAVRP